jgi:dienelactone hydrolase
MTLTPLLLLILLAQDPDAHSVGSYVVSFKEAHPLSELKALAKRQGWGEADLRKKEPDFEKRKVEDEKFQVVVPATYSKEKPAGLVVWISPIPTGSVPGEWHEALAGRNLIGIGADNSGNDRGTAFRVAMALDAVHNMSKRYAIDPKRIYVTGFSGGAKVASRLGFVYPEVFAGGIYQGGIGFYRGVQDPADAKKEFPASFAKAEGALLKKIKTESRHVIVAGETDFNRSACKATFELMTKTEGFTRSTYIEMPKQPHVWADEKTWAQALDALDAARK